MEIKEITARETYPVRHPVLRAGRPIEDCAFDGDDLKTTIHLGVYSENGILAVASLMMNHNATILGLPHLIDQLQYQLRGMAVLEKMQGYGLGKKLLLHAEGLLRENQVAILWFNARIKAVPFYEKLGYQTIGDKFDIPSIGAHYKMYKEL